MTTTHSSLDLFKVGLAAGKLPFFSKSGIEHLRRVTTGLTEFRFDEPTSHALGKLSMQELEHLAPLLPDIRLPLRTCAVSFDVPAAKKAAAEGSTFAGLEVFQDIGTYNKETCTFVASQNPNVPVVDFFFIDIDEYTRRVMIFPMIYRFDAHRPYMTPMFWGNVNMRCPDDWAKTVSATEGYKRITQRFFDGYDGPEDVFHYMIRAHHVLGSAIARNEHNRASVLAMREIVSKVGTFITSDFDKEWAVDGVSAGGQLFNGGVRYAIAALAMLSMRDVEVLEVDRPTRKPGMIRVGNRSAPYWQHSSVRLTVPSVRYVYLVKRHAQKILRRRHHVIGHWVNRGGDRACAHTWADIDLNHKRCSTCGRNRYWRKEFDRGDASLGWVQHDRYNVVSPHKQDTLLEQVNVVLSHR